MQDEQLQKLIERSVLEAVGKSHQAVTKVQSEGFNDVKIQLALLEQKVEMTLEQTKKTNGRTTKNEGSINLINTKLAYIYGGIAILSALGVTNLITWSGS